MTQARPPREGSWAPLLVTACVMLVVIGILALVSSRASDRPVPDPSPTAPSPTSSERP